MSDGTANFKPSLLFKELESVFKKIGFIKQQVVIMDITAGAYLVTNPSGDLPRIICTSNERNELKIEYSQLSNTNIDKFSTFLTSLRVNHMKLREGQIVDTTTGTIVEDFDIETEDDFDYSKELTNMVLESKDILNSLKLYLTFLITKSALLEIANEETTNLDSNFLAEKKLRFEDETLLILDFISKKTTKCIQSKHLLELYPQSTKSECFMKLKTISQRGYLTQSGPWFLLNQQTS